MSLRAEELREKAEMTRALSHDLQSAFVWEDTDDGHEYWSNVNKRLLWLLYKLEKQLDAERKANVEANETQEADGDGNVLAY